MDLKNLRQEYQSTPLLKEEMSANPTVQFEKWFSQALNAEVTEVNAMSLSTVSKDNIPSSRTVLLKYFDETGFVFFTNLKSQKSIEIKENANVALLFPWLILQRQVRISGKATQISTMEAAKYFSSRPRGSQIGAWVSQQSSIISNKQLLKQKFNEFSNLFKGKSVEMPGFWGGFRVVPERVEFWQGQQNRLHDRLVYQLTDSTWDIKRLQP